MASAATPSFFVYFIHKYNHPYNGNIKAFDRKEHAYDKSWRGEPASQVRLVGGGAKRAPSWWERENKHRNKRVPYVENRFFDLNFPRILQSLVSIGSSESTEWNAIAETYVRKKPNSQNRSKPKKILNPAVVASY